MFRGAAAAGLLLLWLAAVVGVEKWIKKEREPKFSDVFFMDFPPAVQRRQGMPNRPNLSGHNTEEKIIDQFYKPYYHQGDIVYMRTTPQGNAKYVPANEMKEYVTSNTANYLYQDCNIACPPLYTNTGPVCGQREKQWIFSRTWKRKRKPYTFRDGFFYWAYAKTFPSLCALQLANCRNHYIPVLQRELKDKELWRFTHFGVCPRASNPTEVAKYNSEVAFEKAVRSAYVEDYYHNMSATLLAISKRGVFDQKLNPKKFLYAK